MHYLILVSYNMDYKCFEPGCTISPSLICYCTSNPSALCHLHILNHSQKNPKLVHDYKSVLKVLRPEMKKNIKNFLNSKIEYLKNECERINSVVINILSTVRKIVKNFHENNQGLIGICNQLLLDIIEDRANATLFRKSKEDSDQVCVEDYMLELRKRFAESKNTKSLFKSVQSNLINKCKEFESYLSNSFCVEIGNMVKEANPLIYGFSTDAKKFIIFNIDNLKINKMTLAIHNFRKHAMICPLPNEKIFILYKVGPSLLSACLFDPSTKLVEKLQDINETKYACCIYYNEKIYFFGAILRAFFMSYNISCNAYDLHKRQWSKIAQSPKSMYNASILDLNGVFLIAGSTNFMCTYL